MKVIEPTWVMRRFTRHLYHGSTDIFSRTLNNDIPGHNLSESLNLKGDRYNLVVAMFFVVCRYPSFQAQTDEQPYVIFEFPSNIA
jgi:hypothetical protein